LCMAISVRFDVPAGRVSDAGEQVAVGQVLGGAADDAAAVAGADVLRDGGIEGFDDGFARAWTRHKTPKVLMPIVSYRDELCSLGVEYSKSVFCKKAAIAIFQNPYLDFIRIGRVFAWLVW
jgi:hypothetical protein